MKTAEGTDHLSVVLITDFVDGGGYAAAQQHLHWLEAKGIHGRLLSAIDPIVENEKAIYFAPRIMSLKSNLRAMKAFRNLWIKEGKPRIISHGLRSAFLAFASTGRRPAFISHGYNEIADESWIKKAARRIVFSLATTWSSPACSVAPINLPGFEFIPWPSPALGVSRESARRYAESDATSGLLKVLWVGRLEFTQKRPDLLLEALRGFPEKVSCRMIGTGPAESELRAMATQYGIELEIINSADVELEMQRCHVLVLLSNFEGVPFVLQEALARGVPVITSPLPGNQWLCGSAPLYASSVNEVSAHLQKVTHASERKRLSHLSRARWGEVAPIFQDTQRRAVAMARS
jgi:glycosyltransferase involved in cell wall biosynthesis